MSRSVHQLRNKGQFTKLKVLSKRKNAISAMRNAQKFKRETQNTENNLCSSRRVVELQELKKKIKMLYVYKSSFS